MSVTVSEKGWVRHSGRPSEEVQFASRRRSLRRRLRGVLALVPAMANPSGRPPAC